MFYSIDICFSSNVKIKILDSYKLIPLKVKNIPKDFGLEVEKLEIDYNEERKVYHALSKQDEDYIKNDVIIVAKALEIMFNEGLTKITRASCALDDYKKTIGSSKFDRLFPPLKFEEDQCIRECYRGGYTYLSPEYAGLEVKNGVVLDVNSLYPHCMKTFPMCYGESVYYEGKYEKDVTYDLYIQVITCRFELKPNKIPTIQIKGMRKFFHENEYLESSKGERLTLCLTSIDLEIFLEHYNVYEVDYEHGWKYKSLKNGLMFGSYIDKWVKKKNEGTIHNNISIRTLAKAMLNSLYGKFRYFYEKGTKNTFFR